MPLARLPPYNATIVCRRNSCSFGGHACSGNPPCSKPLSLTRMSLCDMLMLSPHYARYVSTKQGPRQKGLDAIESIGQTSGVLGQSSLENNR